MRFLRAGTGLTPALCGGMVGAHPVLLINPIQNKKAGGGLPSAFLVQVCGDQSGCLPREARISRLMRFLRAGTGLTPALCGGMVGAHPVLLINPIQNKKAGGGLPSAFLVQVCGDQSGCLPREARISRLMRFLRAGTGLTPALCGGMVGAHPVLLINPIQNKKAGGRTAFGFSCTGLRGSERLFAQRGQDQPADAISPGGNRSGSCSLRRRGGCAPGSSHKTPHKIKKPGADCLRLFLYRSAGDQSGCLPREARISRLMASSPGSNSCPASAMSQR